MVATGRNLAKNALPEITVSINLKRMPMELLERRTLNTTHYTKNKVFH